MISRYIISWINYLIIPLPRLSIKHALFWFAFNYYLLFYSALIIIYIYLEEDFELVKLKINISVGSIFLFL